MSFDEIVDYMKKKEGCRLKAYKCPAGKWTIGYGQTKNIREGMAWTQKQADDDLIQTIKSLERKIRLFCDLIDMIPNKNQVAALISFVYNCGLFNLLRLFSSAAKVGSPYNPKIIAEKMLDFDHGDGKQIPGLLARRLAEGALYLTPEKVA